MSLSFAHDLINSLLEKNFKLSLLADVSIVLHACVFEESALIFHLFPQGVDHALVSHDLFLFGFDFASRLVDQRSVLLLRLLEGADGLPV